MNRLASPAQLRASVIRWALFLVPGVILLAGRGRETTAVFAPDARTGARALAGAG